MTTNATVEARHYEAAQAPGIWLESQIAHAQTLANLEAARAENADLTNRLAEIARLLATYQAMFRAKRQLIEDAHALASGHTPSPCPSCAAKDEAMAERAREVSEAIAQYERELNGGAGNFTPLRRFIIPPADPVAEALKAEPEPAFDPAAHMKAPFRAFLEAVEECAKHGYLVAMRPDTYGDKWEQQLFVLPLASVLSTAELKSRLPGGA